MKKLLLFCAVSFIGTYAFSQSQRMVLFEEFTQASCPPCAAANPGLDVLLNNNHSTVVSVKYHTSWPGVDPMNAHNPTQVATRVSYYGTTGVPDGVVDGGAAFHNQPAGLTQSVLTSRAAVASPFTVTVTHHLSATHDTIFMSAHIACTQAVSTPTTVAHVAVIERMVYFTTAPGSNGEKTFPGLMKQMLPSDQGTAMPASWAVGDFQDLNYSWKLANVYDTNQLAVVVWVQSNATGKNVFQAGYSRPNMANDAGIASATGFNFLNCNTTITPTVKLHNYAINTLTSVNITSQVDAGPITTLPWTGNLTSDNEISVVLASMTLTTGAHTLTFGTNAPNASTDLDAHNDKQVISVFVVGAPVVSPLVEGFTAVLFPPSTGWSRENVGGDAYQWIRAAAGNPSYSAEINFYNETAGTDNLNTPKVNFSNAITGAQLTFDVAYAQYAAGYNDQLKVNVSTDCGVTWTTVYNKSGATLSTHTGYVTTSYTPVAGEWRNEVVSLNSFVGQSDIIVQFQGISAYGNNLYVENVNITDGTTGVNLLQNSLEGVNVYPNPSHGEFNVDVKFNQPQNLTINVRNNIGEMVKTIEMKNVSSDIIPINMTGVSKGTYIVTIKTDSDVITKRISVVE